MSLFLYYIIQKFLYACNSSDKITRTKCCKVGSRIQGIFAWKESQQPDPKSKPENAHPRALGSGKLIWYTLLESKISKQVAFWAVSLMGTSSCSWDQQLQSIAPAFELPSPGLLQGCQGEAQPFPHNTSCLEISKQMYWEKQKLNHRRFPKSMLPLFISCQDAAAPEFPHSKNLQRGAGSL